MRTLSVESSFSAPLAEVSGLAIQRIPGQPLRLLAVSDRSYRLALGPLGDGTDLALTLQDTEHLFAELAEEDASQWEAVACDRAGRVLLLQESPGTLFVLDPALATRLATVHIEAGVHAAGAGWRREPGSRGEGMVLLESGHLLVLKEKDPTQLLELGPPGDAPQPLTPGGEARFVDGSTLTILASWDVDEDGESAGDLSELSVGPDGALYVLGDREGVLCRLGPLPVGGGILSIAERWQLPEEVTSPSKKKGKRGDERGKPEGLVLLDDGRPLVAIDKQKSKGKTLFLLEPLR